MYVILKKKKTLCVYKETLNVTDCQEIFEKTESF